MKFNQDIIQVIRNRYSSRTFDKKPLNDETILEIKKFLTSRKGPLKNEVRFEFIDSSNIFQGKKVKIGTYGLVKNARYFIIGIMKTIAFNLIDHVADHLSVPIQ